MTRYTYQRPVPLEITADEVLREFGNQPHLLLRITVRGEAFPHRAIEPFARIESNGKTVEALVADVEDDQRGLRGYFPSDVALRGMLVVGYGSEISANIPFAKIKLRPSRLDPEKIEGRFHRVTLRDLGAFRRRS